MTRQLYGTGRVVNVARHSLSGPSTSDRFVIVRRYPVANLPDLYWVRNLVDSTQRMVPVSELSSGPHSPAALASPNFLGTSFAAAA